MNFEKSMSPIIFIFTENIKSMDIAANIAKIKNNLPAGVKLVAVSKTKPNEDIIAAYTMADTRFSVRIKYRN
jgi:uncharacterized pyridoxal phosphate-containing UPF0001 family protein